MTARFFIVFLIFAAAVSVLGQSAPTSSARAIRSYQHDVSPPLRNIPPSLAVDVHLGQDDDRDEREPGRDLDIDRDVPVRNNAHRQVAPRLVHRAAPAVAASAVVAAGSASISAGLAQNFDGISGNGWAASDANGAVGATQYLQWVNTKFAVYSKTTGALLFGPVNGNTLWSGFGGACQNNNSGDPIVLYDQIAGRWVMMQHTTSAAPYFMCFAVSKTSDATGSWNRYAYQLTTLLPDYPKMAIWPDGYYVTIALLTNTFHAAGTTVCALDRAAMIQGTAASTVCFTTPTTQNNLLPSNFDGSVPPPAGSPNYLLNMGTNSLNLWKFHVDFQTPANSTFTGPAAIPVAAFTPACSGGVCIPQGGNTQLLDSLGDRLMYRLAYRHFSDGHEALVANHTVGNPAGIRWYEIRDPGGAPTVFQQGTYQPDTSSRWMGSAGMDRVGDIAIGYSLSSSTQNPAIAYTGRVPTDPAGTLPSEQVIFQGAASQVGSDRWGDYSGLAIDSSDDCTFWYTSQYYATSSVNGWSTRIASFRFPTCGTGPVSITPGGLTFSAQNIGVTGAAQTLTLANNQPVALEISGITTSGDFAQTNNCPATLAANASCTISVAFTPTAPGTRVGLVTVTDGAPGSPQTAALSGIGNGPAVGLSATTWAFGSFGVGTSSTAKAFVVTNTGTAPLTLNAVTGSGNFAETDNCTGSAIPVGSTCTINVTFSPTVVGALTGVVTITDNAPGSPQLIALAGSGVPQIQLVPLNLSYGNASVGSTTAGKAVTLTNFSGTTASLSFAVSGAYGISSTTCGSTLPPRAKCTFNVTFSPKYNGFARGGVSVTTNASPAVTTLGLSGTGFNGTAGPLTFSTLTVNFSNVVLGTTTAAKSVTVTNSSGVPVNISSVIATGGYTVAAGSPACGGTLSAGAVCRILVKFAPTVVGATNGAITITDNAAVSPQMINLTGTAILPVALSASSLAFGNQTTGTSSAPQTVTLTNNQSSALTIQSVVASGNYSITAAAVNPCGSTVPALGSCNLAVIFSPSAAGSLPGVATITHDALASPQVVALSGSGQ